MTTATECQWYFLASCPMNSASPWVVPGDGLKQINLTPAIGRGQPSLDSGVPREITRNGARCCRARPSGGAERAARGVQRDEWRSTFGGSPRSGQTNNRVVAASAAMTMTASS